nr:putative glycoside hydrolase [Alkalicella caledoniensis]
MYLTGNSAGLTERFASLVDMVNETELNSMVIDVKDDKGEISFLATEVELAHEIGAPVNKIRDIEAFMEQLAANNIYPIARIVVFKDNKLGRARQDLAVKNLDGSLWVESGSNVSWVDPHSREVWEYVADIAKEAARLGFREIQLDYIRFPDRVGDRVRYDHKATFELVNEDEEQYRAKVIAEFMKFMASEIEPYDVELSADIFGLIGTTTSDMGIGQHLETILGPDVLDIICPMVYPSHYAHNNYGLYPSNNARPYETIKYALLDYQKRMEEMGSETLIRPWLQGFTQGKPAYGPHEVREQIRAARELGINEYLIWNAGNQYHHIKDAFK